MPEVDPGLEQLSDAYTLGRTLHVATSLFRWLVSSARASQSASRTGADHHPGSVALRRAFGLLLAPYSRLSFEVLRRGRRWRRGEDVTRHQLLRACSVPLGSRLPSPLANAGYCVPVGAAVAEAVAVADGVAVAGGGGEAGGGGGGGAG